MEPLLKKYDLPEAIDLAERVARKDFSPEEVHEGDLAIVAHLVGRYRKDLLLAARSELSLRKSGYDQQNPPMKTPFALRDIKDPVERKLIFSNLDSFATTHGCTGGCQFCGADAFITNQIITIPLPQKIHFFDELHASLHEADETDATFKNFVRGMPLYADSDSFDDPDIAELMKYLYGKYGVTPMLSTTLPKRGEENFKYLAGAAQKHAELRLGEDLQKKLPELPEILEKAGVSRVAELYEKLIARDQIQMLGMFLKILEEIKKYLEDQRKDYLGAFAYKLKPTLDYFNLGLWEDYVEIDEAKITRVREEFQTRKEKSEEAVSIVVP